MGTCRLLSAKWGFDGNQKGWSSLQPAKKSQENYIIYFDNDIGFLYFKIKKYGGCYYGKFET